MTPLIDSVAQVNLGCFHSPRYRLSARSSDKERKRQQDPLTSHFDCCLCSEKYERSGKVSPSLEADVDRGTKPKVARR